ncbi:MAG TPA: DUF5662 family protein [Amaricoccus sp.]|uniref:DUF5662 family protein n=1 Tax=Amaricoccus sp. TaxID=1872485 RepID=UPI002B638EEC|nr:DUF5662 family protein [Amaricoccus sp.]HMQ92509.1 DUF5662 family protein [Amaricoccus sp.]HMR53842.1 DUF5662 family protein [Amaricoccus sp.]HMR58959.1 DUF5662 family protein [Amaricoccus sp.]HMU00837.1 DUF5662 family protein [Amaricoccus sp.]
MNSKEKTLLHIRRVAELMGDSAQEIIRRGTAHDASKLTSGELGPLAEMDALIARDGNVPFGSEAYEQRRTMLGPMLDHHYAHNSHHPEHYHNGVSGMCLFDVVEMLMDWKAASERGEQSSIGMEAAFARFGIHGQLADVIRNTVERRGWE